MTTWPVLSTPHAMYLNTGGDILHVTSANLRRGAGQGDDGPAVGDHEALGHEGGPARPQLVQGPRVRPEAGVYELRPGLTGLGITIMH